MKQVLFLLLLFCSNYTFSQNKPIKWGRISQEEADFKVVEYDSSATAVILCDYGKITAIQGEGAILNRHIRIKILDESAKDQANVKIPFYHKNGNERISSRSAHTINVVNGKPVKTAVSKKDFFKAQVNENWSELRFSFPDVKAGSILEYSYTKESNGLAALDSWIFPNEIPTLKSFCHLVISGNLDYNILFQGQRIVKRYEGKTSDHWVLENLPAIKDEPFCPNPFDFTDKIKFQLAGYVSNGTYLEFMTTWKKVAGDFYDEGIRLYLNKNRDAASIIDQIITEGDAPEEKVKKIYDYVVHKFIWDRRYRMLPVDSYKDFKKNLKGNSAEINLYFINLLQSAGFEAYPTLVSTKKHGFVSRSYVFFSQFNHLIACVKLNDQDLLVDATNKFRPYNLLDDEDLNREALVLNKKEPYWVEIKPFKQTKNIKLITMEMSDSGLIKYKMEVNAKGYEALEMREDIAKEEKNLKSYFNKKLIKENAEYQIENIEIKDLDDKSKAVYLSAEIVDKSLSTENGDFIYITPFVDRFYDTNPFNDKERNLPVDLYYPFEDAYILNFKIPEGYEVIEYPETLHIATEGKKGVLRFSANQTKEIFQLRVSFSIKNPFFMPVEYPVLREIYDRYIEKREGQIVLKKKS